MKTKTKTILLLLATFILGALSGASIQRFYIRHFLKRNVQHMRTPEGFVERFERIIQPAEEQKKEIRSILMKHHKEMMQFHHEFPARMDSLKKELDTVLTEEQRKRLQNEWIFSPKKEHHRGKYHHNFKEVLPDPQSSPPPPSPDRTRNSGD
jgi:hypothetical protein